MEKLNFMVKLELYTGIKKSKFRYKLNIEVKRMSVRKFK
jgi:hypothetical protein